MNDAESVARYRRLMVGRDDGSVKVESENGAGRRIRGRVPTSVVLTLLGTLLAVWLAPAFTRQWDDRQAARDLKVGLAEQGVISAFKAVNDGAGLAEGKGRYDAILGRWKEAALKIQLNAKTYFASSSVVDGWQQAGQNVEYFLLISQDFDDVRSQALHPADGRSVGQYKYEEISQRLKLLAPPGDDQQVDQVAHLLASDRASDRAFGMEQVKEWPLRTIEIAADELLSAHPSGFSTTRTDLLDDLLP